MKLKRLDGYIRVSRIGARDVDSESYITEAVQRDKIETWAKLRGVKIAQWHVDRDQSGSKLTRPGFDAAMKRIEDGKTDGIVVAAIDRLSRADVADALMIVRRIHDDFGGTVAAVDLGIDPTTEVGEMLLTVLLALARMQWRRYQAAWDVAKTRAIKRGVHIGPTPLGYLRDNGRLVPDPASAPAVQEAYRLAATQGLRFALAFLRRSRLTRTSNHRRLGPGEHERYWDSSDVRRFLSNRVYLGEASYGAGLVNHDAHEPLVDLATWTAANRLIDANKNGRALSEGYPLSLSGVVCASCGDRLVGHKLERGRRAYRCRRNRRRGPQPCPAPAMVTATPFEEYVKAALMRWAAENLPDEGMGTLVPTDSGAVAKAESALRSAELARSKDAADLRLRETLGDEAFYARLEAHNDAIAKAQQAYEDAIAEARPEVRPPLVEEIETAPAEELPGLLERCGVVVRVAPGRGNLPDRVTLEAR